MKTWKMLSAFLLTLLLCTGMMAVPAYAASTSQDGLEVSLTTDKDSYQQGETMTAVLTVTNTNPVAVKNVSMETLLPEGYQLVDGSEAWMKIASLDAGETVMLTASFAADNTDSEEPDSFSPSGDGEDSGDPSAPQDPPSFEDGGSNGGSQGSSSPGTGERQNIILWVGLFVLTGGVLIASAVYKKKRGIKVLSLLLCTVMVGNLILSIQVNATGRQGTVNLETSVTMNGEELAIGGIVQYDYEPLPGSTCTVTFETDDGSVVSPIEVKVGETISAPQSPHKDGFVFTGWYTSAGLEELFLFDSDVIMEDTTLYAGWEEANPDMLLVESAALQLVVGYQQGDDAGHVTKDVTLPVQVEEVPGVTITWESDSTAIDATGSVTRPQGADESVTLTATATKNEASYRISFSLNVVGVNDRAPGDIPNYSVIDLENMNPDEDFNISYNEDKTQVVSIEGKFSEFPVENADDALDAIYGIRTILGINDPYEELETLVINESEYGAEYTFAQSYEGTEVYSRRITVSADKNGTTDSLSSGACATEKLSMADSTPAIDVSDAEAAALASFGGEVEVDSSKSILTYYALDEYKNTPVLTYLVTVSGTDATGAVVGENVFVNAKDGSIVNSITQIRDASTKIGSGKNEQGNKVSFPVSFNWIDWYFYYMQDLKRNIQMYHQKGFLDLRIGSELNKWTDATAISAYTNMIKTFDWYKNNLGRDSVDGNGYKLKVIVHNDETKDNAFWSGTNKTLNFCDNSNGKKVTTAAALDVIAHEYTHGVVDFTTGGLPYENATGAIDEGYADIFGCLVDGDWEIGEDWRQLRDASDPTAYNAPDKKSSPLYIDYTRTSWDNGGIHVNSSLVYHAAYLMNSYGLSKDALANLWYQSLSMGFDGTSDFRTVRTNVLKAAKKIGFSQSNIDLIKRAFDKVEIYGPTGLLSGTVMDMNHNPIEGATVTVFTDNIKVNYTTDADGSFSSYLMQGPYTVTVEKDGYVKYLSQQMVEESEAIDMNVFLVQAGHGAVEGTVVSATSAQSLPGVALKVRAGMNIRSGDVVQSGVTDQNGHYSFGLDAGYYTIEMSLSDYTIHYVNVIVQGDQTTVANGSLSPLMTSSNYRVVLTWGKNPSDLDSHLTGTIADGTPFHIYYFNKVANKEDGTPIGNLDVDDTTSYGPETTTFTVDTEGSYYFYVHRFSGFGSLSDSEAKVAVYNGEKLIARYEIDPSTDSYGQYWNVFKIENGILTTIDTITQSPIIKQSA